jgi:hypothetical protein
MAQHVKVINESYWVNFHYAEVPVSKKLLEDTLNNTLQDVTNSYDTKLKHFLLI